MSYEGFSQVLCANGHLREFDCWEVTGSLSELGNCKCGMPYIFEHMVDETNGIEEDNPSTLRYPFEINSPEILVECKSCGIKHVDVEVTYKIPER